MPAYPATAANSGAPTRRFGPDGELGIGSIHGPQLWWLAKVIGIPSFVLLALSFNGTTFLIWFCSFFVVVRLSRLEGTPELVEEAAVHWALVFAGASAALLALARLADAEWPVAGTLHLLGTMGYFYAAAFHFTARRLLSWEPARNRAVPAAELSVENLRTMRQEIASGQASLPSLPVFDHETPELVNAWESRDASRIADLLQQGNLLTENSWMRAIAVLNRAAEQTDRARVMLNALLAQARQRLAPFDLDYGAIEVERSTPTGVDFTPPIPRSLTVRRIDAQNTAFIRGASTTLAKGVVGNASPVAALVLAAGALVAQQAYTSRTLRRLKEVEGQLVINSQAARGDLALIGTVLLTRMIPQFDGLVALVPRLQAGLSEVPPGADPSDPPKRESAMRLAFAVIEGGKLVATMAGD